MALIELQNIKKSYFTEKLETKVLHDINLKIDEGEFVAIMGPSGSGKSTLMNIMGFLDVPTQGKYIFENKRVADFDEDVLATIRNKKIGFIFQLFYLLPRMTALDNVRLPMIYADIPEKEQRQRSYEALKMVGLEHRINYRPNELSGGQQQRVAIARSLTNNPKILFADEPTGNLDSKSSNEIMDIIKKLNQQGKTIIMVTHNKNVAKCAHRIVTIKDGNIISNKVFKNKKCVISSS